MVLLRQLADIIGQDVPDCRDGHARWGLYRQVATQPGAAVLLRKAAEAEADPSISSAIVVMMLERIDPSERRQWVEVLDPSVRSFSEIRSRELEIFESLVSNTARREISPDILAAWSDWLQRKVVESIRDERLLSDLAEFGRTKRIRRLAREALAR